MSKLLKISFIFSVLLVIALAGCSRVGSNIKASSAPTDTALDNQNIEIQIQTKVPDFTGCYSQEMSALMIRKDDTKYFVTFFPNDDGKYSTSDEMEADIVDVNLVVKQDNGSKITIQKKDDGSIEATGVVYFGSEKEEYQIVGTYKCDYSEIPVPGDSAITNARGWLGVPDDVDAKTEIGTPHYYNAMSCWLCYMSFECEDGKYACAECDPITGKPVRNIMQYG